MIDSIAPATVIQNRYYVLRVLRPLEFGWLYSVVDRATRQTPRTSRMAPTQLPLCCLEEFILPPHLQGHGDRLAEQLNFELQQWRDCVERIKDRSAFPDYGEVMVEGDRLFVKQFYMEHFSYTQVLEDRELTGEGSGVLTEEEAWELLDGLEPVLKSLHRHGFSHGNLSPDTLVWQVQAEKPGLMHWGGVKLLLTQVGLRPIHSLGFEASVEACPMQTDWVNLAETVFALMGNPEWNQLSLQLAQRLNALLEIAPKSKLPVFNRQPIQYQPIQYQPLNPPTPNDWLYSSKNNDWNDGPIQQAPIQQAPVRQPRPRSKQRSQQQLPKRSFKRIPSIAEDPVLWGMGLVILGLIGFWGYRTMMSRSFSSPISSMSSMSSMSSNASEPNSLSNSLSNNPSTLPSLNPTDSSSNFQSEPPINLPSEIKTQLQQFQVSESWFVGTIDELLGQSGISPEESRWKDASKNLIQALEKLKPEARQGIGNYRRSDFDSWLTKANKSSKAFEEQTDQQFFSLFPDRKGKALNPRQLGQVWYAIARGSLN